MRAICILLLFIISTVNAVSEEVDLKLIKNNGAITIRSVDKNRKSLSFALGDYTSIKGLEKLPFLQSLIFENMAEIKDFTFLTNLKIKFLYIADSRILDFSFLNSLNNLITVQLDGCSIPSKEIDLLNLSKLRYLRFSNIRIGQDEHVINHILNLKNIPNGILVLDYSFNEISSISMREFALLEKIPSVYFYNNPVLIIPKQPNIKMTPFSWEGIEAVE